MKTKEILQFLIFLIITIQTLSVNVSSLIEDDIYKTIQKLRNILVKRSFMIKIINLYDNDPYDYYIRKEDLMAPYFIYNTYKTPQFYALFNLIDHNASEYLKNIHTNITAIKRDFIVPSMNFSMKCSNYNIYAEVI